MNEATPTQEPRFGKEFIMGGDSHVELKWRGAVIFIDVTEDKISITSRRCLDVSVTAANALEIAPWPKS